jgi:hypothetical protein
MYSFEDFPQILMSSSFINFKAEDHNLVVSS